MKPDLPPSRIEKEALVRARKRDLPRPSPAPAPKGMGASNDNALSLQRRAAQQREKRIKEIDHRLNKQSNRAVREFTRTR